MGARQKLNAIAVIGVFVLATTVGLTLNSLLAFLVTFAIAIWLAVEAGEIRPDSERRSHRRRK